MLNKPFEQFEIGETWTSHGRTITESDLVNFAGVSGDFFPLHMDSEYAKNTRFKQRIAHGMLVLSIGTGLLDMSPKTVVAFYGIEKLRFLQPTFIGDTIHLELRVTDLADKGNGTGVVTFQQKIKKQTGATVIAAEYKFLINTEGASEKSF
ncbi:MULTISPECIES: MaoC/PaaZ C-terminal domain-containing protein [Ureibacillus]|jgi:3-hydroxybutyryl-CoA dehydratase|uniref:Acyl dehydratase n=1 Tax=Ureibacillus thermosphaericus TaxID=51173 RepID=A0A840PWR8_URETH|nr:MaoC/PaaZ C-terminal domain-containing protein [Ureibacillus thermosphaericus]MBB5149161.1 acyl dehydratase [Ureibacillus thermosphaericus]NKZ31924.1 dehydratase [Ureibacillus thermosphaericus]